MTPYPLTLQNLRNKFYGHLFIAPTRLYFVCSKKGGVWGAAIGQALGGAVGGAITALSTKNPGAGSAAVDESELAKAVAENEGSMIMDAGKIEEIKETIWWRLIRFDGKKFGLPNGLGKDLKKALGPWAAQNNVKTKGLPAA